MNKITDPEFMAELIELEKKLTEESQDKNEIVHFYFNEVYDNSDESCLYEPENIPIDLDDLYNSCKIYSLMQEPYRCGQCYKNAVMYKEKYENNKESSHDKIIQVLVKLLSKYI